MPIFIITAKENILTLGVQWQVFFKNTWNHKKPQEFGKPYVWDSRKSFTYKVNSVCSLNFSYLAFVEFNITFHCNSTYQLIKITFTTSIYLSTLPFMSRRSTSSYTNVFWISCQVKAITSPSVLLTIQHFRRWTLWMQWKVNRGNAYPNLLVYPK